MSLLHSLVSLLALFVVTYVVADMTAGAIVAKAIMLLAHHRAAV
jgi:hypothetical protein